MKMFEESAKKISKIDLNFYKITSFKSSNKLDLQNCLYGKTNETIENEIFNYSICEINMNSLESTEDRRIKH